MRKYSLDLIMARLSKGAENSISMAFVVMCAEKIRRLLRLFLSLFLPGYATGNGQVVSGWDSGTFGSLKHTNHWPLDNREFGLPTPCYLAAIESSVRFAFSGVPHLATRSRIPVLVVGGARFLAVGAGFLTQGGIVTSTTARRCGGTYNPATVRKRTMSGEDASRLIDDTLDLVHQRLQVLQAQALPREQHALAEEFREWRHPVGGHIDLMVFPGLANP